MNKWIKVTVGALVGLSLVVGVMGTAMAAPNDPGTAGYGQGGGMGMGFRFGGLPDSIATLLGLDREQIAEQRQDGKSLVDIAKSAPKPADEAALVNAIVAERQKVVDQRVADGKLTTEQAAQVMERMKTQVAASVSRTTTGPNRPADGLGLGMGMGRNGGNGGNGNRYNGNCPYINQAPANAQ